MGDPVLAKGLQCARRQGDVAVFGPLAAMNVDHHPPAVDVADLEVQPLAQSQAQRVNGPEIGPVVGRADRGDEPPDFLDGEHVGEPLVPADAELLERGPVAGCGVGVEELDAAVGDDQ